MRNYSAFLLFVVAILCAASAAHAQAVAAQTSQGRVVGAYTGPQQDIEVFKGIPYAIPPVGVRRWRAAEPAGSWAEPLIANRFGPDCMQSSTMDVMENPEKDTYYHPPSLVSEDCLYLNVWAPAKRATPKLPVMVWIHGGGLVQGAGTWPLYDGTALARKGVVLVTLNYRLGIFARFALAELSAESPQGGSGTYDLSDLVQALKWVQQNIAAFGGDPANVTVFGESAGSLYVAALMASPPAKGLFHRAIGESGGIFNDWMTPLGVAQAAGSRFAASIGRPSLDALREMPAADLHALSRKAKYYIDPVIDGHFLTAPPCETFLQGKQHRVPVLVGFNGDELNGYLPPLQSIGSYKQYADTVRETFRYMAYNNAGIADGFLSLAPERRWSPQLAPRMLRGYMVTGWEMESWAAMTSRVSPNAWLYYFNHVPPGATGAFHTAEVSYVFNNERSSPRYSPNTPVQPPRPSDLALAEMLSSYWVAFAKTGAPAAEGLPEWKPYGGVKTRRFMEFKEGGAQARDNFFPEIDFKPACEVLK